MQIKLFSICNRTTYTVPGIFSYHGYGADLQHRVRWYNMVSWSESTEEGLVFWQSVSILSHLAFHKHWLIKNEGLMPLQINDRWSQNHSELKLSPIFYGSIKIVFKFRTSLPPNLAGISDPGKSVIVRRTNEKSNKIGLGIPGYERLTLCYKPEQLPGISNTYKTTGSMQSI